MMRYRLIAFILAAAIAAGIGSFMIVSNRAAASQVVSQTDEGTTYLVHNASDAASVAGFKLVDVSSPNNLSAPDRIFVQKSNDGSHIMVQRSWTDPTSHGAIILYQESVQDHVNNGTKQTIAGKSGETAFYTGSGDVPNRTVFTWERGTGSVSVFAVLDGAVNRQVFDDFISSVR